MGSEDLPAVGTSGLRGAVGVEGQLPAAAVNADVMVEGAQQDAVGQGRLAAFSLVAQVVNVAVHCRAAAPGPGAGPVAQQDGPADVRRDRIRV